MIRVGLIEDQTIVREGLENLLLLTEDIRVVAQADNGFDAISVLRQHQPDVVLLDMRMPKMDGIDVLRHLEAQGPSMPVIVLTTFDDDEIVLEAFHLGAKGFLLKDVSLVRLADAIRSVARGEKFFGAALTERLLRALQSRKSTASRPKQDRLTDREIEILQLLMGGFSNSEIAFALRVAEGTVKNHVSNILEKLCVRDRTRAVLKAFELGYLKS
ncbi:response regulator [Terriglobus tenax]|uniref:response regulator n=1 Tax=Terriglobus tenax TaxID=1111115 RepID=UPI0021DFA684|nr:response regulator transcription factor [Terriglobus tenax]